MRNAPIEPRKLRPLMPEAWDLDVDKIVLAGGVTAWGVFAGPVMRARNAFVHQAEPVVRPWPPGQSVWQRGSLTGLWSL